MEVTMHYFGVNTAPSVAFQVIGGVVPGQPVQITWAWYPGLFTGGTGTPDTTVTLTANAYITDPLTNQPLALNEAPFTYTSGTGWGGMPLQKGTLIPPTTRAAQLLYTVGIHPIKMVVDANGSFLSASASVVVFPDGVPFFQNVTTQPASPAWNSAYHVIGMGKNGSQYGIFTIKRFDIAELDNSTGSIRTLTAIVSGSTMQPGAETQMDSGPITQNWGWMDPTVYVKNGPVTKTFTYSTSMMTLVDQFGNSYPDCINSFSG